ncbi:flippase [Mesonia sp. HuA40]|nr:flippase [Mesonia sp. HuA40]
MLGKNLYNSILKKQLIKKLKNTNPDQKDVLKKGFYFLIFRGIGIIAGYLFTLYITNVFGAKVNGLISLSFSVFMFASIIGRLGIDVNFLRFYAKPENWKKDPGLFYRVVSKSFLVSLVLMGVLLWAQDFFILHIFKKDQLAPYYFWSVLGIPFWTVTMLCAGALRAKGLNNWFAFFNNTGRFLLTILLLAVVYLFYTVAPVMLIQIHFWALVVLALIAFWVVSRELNQLTLKSGTNSWRFLRESFPMLLSSTIMVFLGWLDTFILGIYETDENIGIYNAALKLALVTNFSIEAINSSLAPKIASAFAEQAHEKFKGLVKFSTRINFVATAGIVAVLLIFNQFFLGIFGEEFLVGKYVLIILCSIHLLNSTTGSVGIIMQMIGRQKQYQNIALIALGLNLILNFALIPLYGIEGAAAATAISLSFWNIAGTVYLKRKENIRTYL